jgi:PadR family transcriptional regulator PadR
VPPLTVPVPGPVPSFVPNTRDDTGKWEIQVRKGVLELVVLLAVRDGERYGYELITIITRAMDFEMTEGTVYPLLSRLLKEGLVSARWVESEGSVPRKYYRLTKAGERALDAMQESWVKLTRAVQRLASKGVSKGVATADARPVRLGARASAG